MSEILDCKVVRDLHLQESKEYIEKLTIKPRLLIIQVGNREDSNKYIKNKKARCEECGIEVHVLRMSEDSSEQLLINYVKSMQSKYHALIVQCPLPSHIDEQIVMNEIDYKKDCDGLNYINIGLLNSGQYSIVPATAQGIINLLDFQKIDVSGMNILLIGRSNLVNRPLRELLCQRDATVTMAHSKTRHLQDMLSSGNYDMVIGAIGKPKHLKNVNTKYIIDVGINVGDNGKLCGDFDIDTCNCEYFSPVPKGCGLLTQSSIVENVISCYKLQQN